MLLYYYTQHFLYLIWFYGHLFNEIWLFDMNIDLYIVRMVRMRRVNQKKRYTLVEFELSIVSIKGLAELSSSVASPSRIFLQNNRQSPIARVGRGFFHDRAPYEKCQGHVGLLMAYSSATPDHLFVPNNYKYS